MLNMTGIPAYVVDGSIDYSRFSGAWKRTNQKCLNGCKRSLDKAADQADFWWSMADNDGITIILHGRRIRFDRADCIENAEAWDSI